MKKRKLHILMMMLLLLVVLSGCNNKYEKLETKEVNTYLNDLYDGEFSIISVTEQDEKNRYHLDPAMEDERIGSVGDGTCDDIVYRVKDENGIEFHTVAMFDQMLGGSHYEYHNDYCMQLLQNNTEFMELVNATGYPVEHVNDIGTEGWDCGYRFVISAYEDIVTLMPSIYEIVSEERFRIPYPTKTYENIDGYSLYPEFKIVVDNAYGRDEILSFRLPNQETEEVSLLEDYIRISQWNYTNAAREWEEPLPDEVLMQYPPERIRDITFGGEEIEGDLYYGRKSQNYDENWRFDGFVFWDNSRRTSGNEGPSVKYVNLEEFLADIGYEYRYEGDSVIYTGYDREVVISEKDYEYECMIDGELYEAEGILTSLLRLTEQDMERMFGITFEIDCINATAEVILNP